MLRIMTADGPGSTTVTVDGTRSDGSKIRAKPPVRKVPSMSHRSLALLTILAALSWSGLAQDSKKNPKDDPDAIGSRNVGQGVNFYSLEKEIAVGRQLAQEVERHAKVITDPIIERKSTRLNSSHLG